MDRGENGNAGGGEHRPARMVRVRFVTQLPSPLRVRTAPQTVPSGLSRMGLSEIVNFLLKSGTVASILRRNGVDNPEHESEPFDFLIRGELVRMPLDDLLLAKGISVEETLEIEYVKAVVPRKKMNPLPHDDWVSAVDGSNTSFILTGCYDGVARVWDSGATCTHHLKGHSGGITSVKTFGADSESLIHVVTSSKDKSLMLWQLDRTENIASTQSIGAYKILSGHTAAVQSVDVNPSNKMICSGSWDCTIQLWDVSPPEEDDVSLKKRKLNAQSDQPVESQLEGTSTSTLLGHKQCVHAVLWPEDSKVYSASWDYSVRNWDIYTSTEIWHVDCGKALNCLDIGGDNSALVAAGGSDPVLRIWDTRKQGNSAPIFQFSSHTSWVTDCKWHPRSMFHLLTASLDGKVMIWDLRTAWPLAVMDSHQDKVLCADWWKEDSMISGGADSKLCITSGIGI